MDLEKRKTMQKTVGAFLLFLVLKIVEELVVIPKYGIDSMGLISCLGGLLILFIYIRMDNKPLEVIGMLFSTHKFGKGLGLAFVLNLVPMGLVYGLEYSRYSAMEGATSFGLFYKNVGHSLVQTEMKMFLFWCAFGLFISLLHAVFYEMSFRGLLLTLAARSFPFGAVNAIQAVLYTFWYMFPVFRILLFDLNKYSKERIIILAVVMITYQMVTAVKLGLLRRATGSIWVCIFDHLMFAYIMDMIHIQYTTSTGTFTDGSQYVRMIGYQVISLVMALIYYRRKMKKVNAEVQNKTMEEMSKS